MRLQNCPECRYEVSQKAKQCPNCGHIIQNPKRSFFGKIFKFLFILFNVFMFIWLISFGIVIGETDTKYLSDTEMAGVAIGTSLGFTFQFFIWAIGDIILGILTLLTKAK